MFPVGRGDVRGTITFSATLGRPDVVTRYAKQARAIYNRDRFYDSKFTLKLVVTMAKMMAAVFLLLISAHTGN